MENTLFQEMCSRNILIINYLARKVRTCVVATWGSVNYFFVSNNDTSEVRLDNRCSFESIKLWVGFYFYSLYMC